MEEYYKRLVDLLKVEQEEDQKQFKLNFENKSVQERRAEGLTWYPVAIRNTEVQRADYLSIEIERTTHQEVPHSFRVGNPVYFYSNHNPQTDRISAVVAYQSPTRVRIIIKQDELPEWSSDGKLGLDLAFDNTSYQEMFKALKEAGKSTELGFWHGSQPLSFFSEKQERIARLNESQQKAYENMLNAEQLSIVHGPPGTGKTTTLIEGILGLLRKGARKLLVTAPSNTAVDLLAEKLSENGLNVLRVGNPARVSERLNGLTIEEKIKSHPYQKDIKRFRKQADEYRNMAHKYKRNFGRAEREQRKALFDEAYKLLDEVKKLENYILDAVFNEVQIVAATLVGSANYILEGQTYDAVIIDEAGQALEPACWIPILKGKKIILAGDHFQLPPTVKSKEAKALEETLLEKWAKKYPEAVTLLDTQYRMNEQIAAYSSQYFYQNKLHAHASVKMQKIAGFDFAFKFIDTAGCGFDEKLEGTSVANPEEATFVVQRMLELLRNVKGKTIGVISPYKQQLKYLEEGIRGTEIVKNNAVSVNTIDSFQGQERDIIFISLTRSNTESEIGFLTDTRRMNVAMTRAKKLLIIVGDSATIGENKFYEGLIQLAQDQQLYSSAWEYLN